MNIISIVTHFEIIDIVMKFMTLMVLLTFSNIFYMAYDDGEEGYKKIITDKKYKDFLKIQTTTSKQAEGKKNKIEL